MRRSCNKSLLFALILGLALASTGLSQQSARKPSEGKPPVIIIPGLTGSELINSRTGEMVWYKIGRSKDDDIRLPMSADLAANKDSLVPGEIIGAIKVIKWLPETEIYKQLIDALQNSGGYRKADWATASRRDAQDTFFVFPYDWRRDNVENARLLIKRIVALKKRLGKPDLKFNIIAHSMGGLISRYAAMYGDADPGNGPPKPTWAGAKHLNKIFLLGTPNGGSLAALDALLNGVSYIPGGFNLPWVRNLTRFDVFTIPSVFQLLPHNGTLKAYNEDLEPISIDLYEPATWDEYDWSIWKDKDFGSRFSKEEQQNARPYFLAALARAKRFQAAIDANTSARIPVSFYAMGGDCKDTLNGVILRQDVARDRWITQFRTDAFTTSDGKRITPAMLKPLIYSIGDSVVPKRSLLMETLSAENPNILPIASQIFQCETHSMLVTNKAIQDRVLSMLEDNSTRAVGAN